MKKIDISKLNRWELLTLANNENTPASILEELVASTEDSEINRAIAGNPNSSPELLIYLFDDFVKAVLSNPILEILLIENPNLLIEFGNCAPDFFAKEKVPQRILEIWANFPENANTLTLGIAANETVPNTYLERLATSDDWRIRYAVANNSRLSSSSLTKLINDRNKDVRARVANNSALSPCDLAILAKDSQQEVLTNIAANPNTLQQDLLYLSKKSDSSIRAMVAANPSTPLSRFARKSKVLSQKSKIFVL